MRTIFRTRAGHGPWSEEPVALPAKVRGDLLEHVDPEHLEFEGREQHHCEEVCGLKVVRIAPAGRPRRLVRLEEHESPEQVAFVVRCTELVHADVLEDVREVANAGITDPPHRREVGVHHVMTFVASVSVDVDGRELVAEVDGTEPDHAPVRHRGLRKLDADVVAAAESLEDQGRCSLDDEARGLRAENLERCIHGGGGEPLLFRFGGFDVFHDYGAHRSPPSKRMLNGCCTATAAGA